MNSSNWMKRFAAIAGSVLMGLMFATGANAANPEPVPVEVEWIAPITILENNPLQFGLLNVNMVASQTVTINIDDSYSESTAGTVIGPTQAAADLTITAPASTGITITADNPSNGTYYTLGTWRCRYAGGTDTACGSGYNVTSHASGSAVLEVGVTLTAVGSATAITDDSTFDVTVTYQ